MAGCEVELLGARALHWPERRQLLVADLHWGKEATLQAHGMPVPAGSLDDDLARLLAAIEATGATGVTVLGDLIHHGRGVTGAVIAQLERFRAATSADLRLVVGNHDRSVSLLPPSLRLEIVREQLDEGPFRLAHHPEPAAGRYVLAGHQHPVVRLSGGGDTLRLPCFHLTRAVGVLPAFGSFTGGGPIVRQPGDRGGRPSRSPCSPAPAQSMTGGGMTSTIVVTPAPKNVVASKVRTRHAEPSAVSMSTRWPLREKP
ncbi:MAG: ligase-associated DNA damage response endonuclease PdeM [Myxococcales bacterium]|nr:MAG: ligase-associated DNA damage response endonuclease PdeM [Myxococcales bacterium]